jgi:transcriptional regulator
MYIPKQYIENDDQKLYEFIKANSFGIIVSANKKLRGTHLPFVISKKDNGWILTSHMAKANPQWKEFENSEEVLIIFQGPHAYISPSFYEKKTNVPTWNYVAVHAYGTPKILNSEEESLKVLEAMILQYEEQYYSQWKTLPTDYVRNMVKEIVSFEISISTLEGKYKLSQNKTKKEQQNIIESFEKSDDSLISGVADLMKKNIK